MKEKSLFIEMVGESPQARLIDYLLTERELDFSITDMAMNSGISRASLYRLWNNLISMEIIEPTRNIGQAKLFRLNTRNDNIKRLIEFHDALILDDLRRKSEDKKEKIQIKK